MLSVSNSSLTKLNFKSKNLLLLCYFVFLLHRLNKTNFKSEEIKNDLILQQAKLVLLTPLRHLTYTTYTKINTKNTILTINNLKWE